MIQLEIILQIYYPNHETMMNPLKTNLKKQKKQDY